MSKSGRIRALERGLARIWKPALQEHGFVHVARTRGFYRRAGECIQIIEIQPGVRSAEGTFAVNLAVYHPQYHEPAARVAGWPREFDCLMERRQRLGALKESWRTKFFKRLFSDTTHWMKWWLTTLPDRWWPFSEDELQVERSLRLVVGMLAPPAIRPH